MAAVPERSAGESGQPDPERGHAQNIFIFRTLAEKKAAKELAEKTNTTRIQVAEKRLTAMREGATELGWWLRDLMRHGLAGVAHQAPDFWATMARRMVDAKLGGLARRIRLMEDVLQTEDWPTLMMEELALLHLTVEGFERYETLPDGLWADLLQIAGLNFKKEEVLSQAHLVVNDRWQVLGYREGEEEKLRYRRTWLAGEASNRFALLLDYAWGRNEFENLWQRGQVLEADLTYYPSAYPLRALLQAPVVVESQGVILRGLPDFEAMKAAYAAALAANPWLHAFPVLLNDVLPVMEGGQFYLLDEARRRMPLNGSRETCWKLMAMSAGHPMQVFGEWDGHELLCNI